MGLLEKGSLWLNATFTSRESVSIDYWRNQASLWLPNIAARVGRSDRQIGLNLDAASQVISIRDYLINQSALVIASTPFKPAAGDRIAQIVLGRKYTYEVFADPVDGPWTWHDVETQLELRIHTILFKEEAE